MNHGENSIDPAKLRQAEFSFRPVDKSTFFWFLTNRGRSEIGPVGTQFEKEIKANSEKVGIYGLYLCDIPTGVISYGITDLPRYENSVEARFDVVVASPNVRGMGVGGLIMAHLFKSLVLNYEDRLKFVSTVAVHPAVASHIVKYGFQGSPKFSTTPLFTIELTDEGRNRFVEVAENEIAKRSYKLRQRCSDCVQNRSEPWCLTPKS